MIGHDLRSTYVPPATSSLARNREELFSRIRLRSPVIAPYSLYPRIMTERSRAFNFQVFLSRPRAPSSSRSSPRGRTPWPGGGESVQMTVISLPCGFVHHGLIIVHFRRVNNGLAQTSLNGLHPSATGSCGVHRLYIGTPLFPPSPTFNFARVTRRVKAKYSLFISLTRS